MKRSYLLFILLLLAACQNTAVTPTATIIPPTDLPPTETPPPTATIAPTATPGFTPLTILRDDNRPVERLANVPYTNPLQSGIATQQLDLYRPVGAGPWPTVILIHGSGSGKEDIADWAEDAAAAGLLVYAANWPVPPLSSASATTERRWREAAETLSCLISFARATAPDWSGTTERLVLAGFSAGALFGSSTALAGPTWPADWQTWADAQDGPSAQVDCRYDNPDGGWVTAFVGVGGPYDLFASVLGNPAGLDERERGLYDLLVPGALLARGQAIPLRFIHGSGDGRVPVAQSENFAARAAAAGFDSEFILVDGGGHTTLNATSVPIIYGLATGE
ncbi:MAG: alpha/beta hydrolase [Anaerolineales bacterium]|nr:alpha/beta hydrolase [Anaerolineales bacterium]